MTARSANDLTHAFSARMEACEDPRFRTVMTTLVTHLHQFIAEVDLTPEEWSAAIAFLTATGQACTAQRQEFILLSDVLALSMAVVGRAQTRSAGPGGREATEATVQGPYYWAGAPTRALGDDLGEGVPGEPAFYFGRVTDTHGQPIAGALLDVWSGDGEGVYDMQLAGAQPMRARGRFLTDAQGCYWFWSVRPRHYPVPMDGPVGQLLERMGRHPNRPGHIHMTVSAEDFVPVTTHLFVANSPYLDSDAVFGVRESLVVDFDRHLPGRAPDGRDMSVPYWSAHFDFRLACAANGASAAPTPLSTTVKEPT